MSILSRMQNPRSEPTRCISGVTLTEVLISAGIITIVIVGVLLVFVQTVDLSKRINFEYTATNLAKSRLERIRAVFETSGFDSIVDSEETDTLINGDGISDPNGNFRRSTIVNENYNGDTRQTAVEVRLTYRYRGEWKVSATVVMDTIFVDMEV